MVDAPHNPIGPNNTEWNRKCRAVKASDVICLFNENMGTEKPLFVDLLGLEEENYGIAISEGPRTQHSCLIWGLETKPCGSPSQEMPYEKDVWMLVMYGIKEVYLGVGMADGSGFIATTSVEDRVPSCCLHFEEVEPRENDPKICFKDHVRVKHIEGEKTVFLQVTGSGPDGWGLRWVDESEKEEARCTWTVKHGNDFLGTGLGHVHMDPAAFPPKG